MLALSAFLPASPLPAPFSRTLQQGVTSRSDVTILQAFLARAGDCPPPARTNEYDAATAASVTCFQKQQGLTADGVFGHDTAWRALAKLSLDGWRDDGTPAAAVGAQYKYKLLLPVHSNRSVETTATLLDAHNNVLHKFPARTHGHDVDAAGQPVMGVAWPDLTDKGCPNATARQGCTGLNAFSRYGATPTGLAEIDLNGPEGADVDYLYGPYPVNRFVRGLEGNAAFLMPAVRNGILLHTGYWANHSAWRPGQPMPNSAGCVHTYLDDIRAVWQLLLAQGVAVRNNTGGDLPYPFVPQGIAAVFNVD